MSTTPNPVPPISCRLEVLPGSTVLEQSLAARDFGFNGITLPGRFKDRWLASLRECRADLPLPLVALSLGFTGSLLSPGERARQACRDSLLGLLDLCAELQVGLLNLPPCLLQDNPGRITDPAGFPSVEARLDDLLLRQLPELGDAARQRDVRLLLEPVNRYESDYLNSIEHAARLCGLLDHPAIGFTADFFHLQLEELQPAGALRRVAVPHLRHVHVAENTRVEPGPGSLDLVPGFRALKEAGYGGWLEIECRRLSGHPTEVLPRSVDYLRNKWSVS